VLIVKVDNTLPALPHVGLASADVIYIEQVEGGLTRIAAVFATTLPPAVGPVRSARITDLSLFANYGTPAFAYSGAQPRLIPMIQASSLINVGAETTNIGYYRDPSRAGNYVESLMAVPSQLLRQAPHATGAHPIGFTFSLTPPPGGRRVSSLLATWPASTAAFTWDPAAHAFLVGLNGVPAALQGGGVDEATTVVIQYVQETDSGFVDERGNFTPLSHVVGSGTGLVARNGRVYPVSWSRPSLAAGTTFVGANGRPVPFAPGQVWVALVNVASPVAVH